MIQDRLSSRLLQAWTAKGLLIWEGKARYVEVEVPYLAIDMQEVFRAVIGSYEAVTGAKWDKRAFALDVTTEELEVYTQKFNSEIELCQCDLTLAAAILAHRGRMHHPVASRNCLHRYLHRRFLRGGRGVVDECLAEFLFIADAVTPVIYANSPLAEITRFSGRECLSVRVDDEELRLRVQDALASLAQGTPPTPPSLTNLEDWLTSQGHEKDNDNHDV